jgi:ketosteroid isomerase-like protein
MEDQIKDLAARFDAAELQGNVNPVASLLTPDFITIGPRGFTLTREQWLGRFNDGDFALESVERDDTLVRTYGDSAILTAHETNKATYKGQRSDGEFRVSRFFVKNNGGWQLAEIQYSPIMPVPQR